MSACGSTSIYVVFVPGSCFATWFARPRPRVVFPVPGAPVNKIRPCRAPLQTAAFAERQRQEGLCQQALLHPVGDLDGRPSGVEIGVRQLASPGDAFRVFDTADLLYQANLLKISLIPNRQSVYNRYGKCANVNRTEAAMIADRIRLARRKSGYSLRGLSDAMDNKVTAQAIGKYERGEDIPSSGVLLALSKALSVSWAISLIPKRSNSPAWNSEPRPTRARATAPTWKPPFSNGSSVICRSSSILELDSSQWHCPVQDPVELNDVG